MELLPWQERNTEAIVKILRSYNTALDASETGTGKSLTCVAVAKELGLRPFIICPKAVIPSWNRWCGVKSVPPIAVINYEKLRTGKIPWGCWYSEIVRGKELKAWRWTNIPQDTLFIWDEVQKCKTRTSQNAKMLIAAKQFKNVMASATAAKDPLDMFAIGYMLDLHRMSNFWNWAMNNGVKKAPWGAMHFFGGKKYLESLHARIFPHRGVRTRIEELGDAFPENQIIVEAYDLGNVQSIYDEMQAELDELAETKASDTDPDHPLTIRLRARQEIELLRVPTMVEMVENLLDEGKSVCIFVNFRKTCEVLAEKLKAGIVYGEQSAKERETLINEFQSNTRRLLILQYQSGGVGISLHDLDGGHPRTSILSPTYSAIDFVQALGRTHRAGGKSKVMQYVIFAADSVEEEVASKVKRKIKQIQTLNDGDLEDAE